MHKRVLILYTGGTIGMRAGPRGYEPGPGLGELLPAMMPPLLEDGMPEYEVLEFEDPIDSANLLPQDWRRIGAEILSHYPRFDGFVVLHGTDTMAYTAAALSFMLGGLRKPVILTGSQIPLREQRNDARNNLLTALLLAARFPVPEVTLYFNGRLIRGNRATKVQAEGFDAFDSPNYPLLGRVGIRIEIDRGELLAPAAAEDFRLPQPDPARVAVLQVYPGLEAGLLEAVTAPPLAGLVLRSYGAGNAPVRQPGLLQVLRAAGERGLVTVNLTQCLQGRVDQAQYAPGAALRQAGVIGGADLTTEAAFAKLHYLLGLGLPPAQVREQMQIDLRGEMSVAQA